MNVFYLDPEAVPDLAESSEAQALLGDAGFRSELDRARAADLVDYPAVWRLKLRALELLFESFRTRHLASSSARARAFREFRAEMGQALEQHTVFDALHEHALRTTGAWSWHNWPEPLRHPHSIEVAAFAREHRERVDFFAWLQWLADIQLGAAQARARAGGMPIGLYQDIAVAVNPASAMAWANPGVSLSGASVGAPPDWFNPHGQNWVLAPLSPVGLHEGAYAVFAAALRHNMRHAGAVRIDHVMGLRRLFWIPEGGSPADGAYVRYPFDGSGADHRARVGAAPLPGDRRGPRHRAPRVSAGDAARGAVVLPGPLLRARAGRRVPGARGLPAPVPGIGVDPRSPDAQGLLDLSRRGAGAINAPALSGRGNSRAGLGPSASATGSCSCGRSSRPGCCRPGSTRRHRRPKLARTWWWRSIATSRSPPGTS